MTKSMTSGKPVKLILLFALPLIVGNIFQQFYSMADTVIVGRTIGVNALAAVGCTGSVSFFILGFVMLHYALFLHVFQVLLLIPLQALHQRCFPVIHYKIGRASCRERV